jgi:hypothetical protein
MTFLSRSWSCPEGHSVKDEDNMLIELDGKVYRVNHLVALSIRMRARFFGPYCDQACWQANSGDEQWPGVHEDLRGAEESVTH